MVTKEQAIEKYGKEMWDKMVDTGWLDGITCKITPDGKLDIPQYNIDCAYREAVMSILYSNGVSDSEI
jgi:hypothetical protein